MGLVGTVVPPPFLSLAGTQERPRQEGALPEDTGCPGLRRSQPLRGEGWHCPATDRPRAPAVCSHLAHQQCPTCQWPSAVPTLPCPLPSSCSSSTTGWFWVTSPWSPCSGPSGDTPGLAAHLPSHSRASWPCQPWGTLCPVCLPLGDLPSSYHLVSRASPGGLICMFSPFLGHRFQGHAKQISGHHTPHHSRASTLPVVQVSNDLSQR